MKLTTLDFLAIFGYLAATLLMGLYFRRRSGKSTADYFVSGRQVSWWLAGTSMVATTFAADTPLAVTGLVYSQGIAGNWLWWSFLPSGMMTVFLFARLWRRSGLLTDVQFAEMRYAGKPAAFLRGFRAVYLGLLMNCLILGWVTKAMTSIVSVTLGMSEAKSLALCIFFLMPFTGLYVSLGGLWGVLWTDLFQFVLKMAIVIAVAWYGVQAAGGMHGLIDRLALIRAAAGPNAADITKMLPDFSRGWLATAVWTLPVLTFVLVLFVQWWASWYPGAEPGGGGYVAQRIFSAKDEKNGLLSVLWFNVAHYAIRPWPWILAALVAVALYPNLAHPESGYMLVATNFMPAALRGILIAGFMAAFMSTLATQLNWGSSYLVVDFYRRFLKEDASEGHYVVASRLVTMLLVLAAGVVSWELASIREGWKFVLEIGAGTGGVYLLRWYWWRINAWSEISAMVVALVCSVFFHFTKLFGGAEFIIFAKTTLWTVATTTVAWVAVTMLTRPEPDEVLVKFYRKVRPHVAGWSRVARMAPEVPETRDLGGNLFSWVLGCAMVYAALFATGELLFGRMMQAAGLYAAAAISAALLYRRIARMVEKPEPQTSDGVTP
ncbi:MAG TPA: sodium:solute symporter family protein [Candidatus Acidoferrales bacterium]|jgi:Na+/proline symporter|nr:sodium:solute symporter family protein [Candidatus Acidoferrales bacterium]